MKKYIPLVALIILAGIVRLWWLHYMNYAAEDGYITFQFARNIARGEGFALNPGHPVYGSTTPLLSILLAGWLLISKDILWGARAIDLIGVVGGMVFLYLAIPDKRAAFIALFITSISARLYIEEMQGMEMSLTFLFLAASFYGFMRRRPVFAGLMAGLLLWARVDTVIWVSCLFAIYLWIDRRQALKYFLATTAIYLPWILFSWAYFGSPIPLTFTAKQIAYGPYNSPILVQLQMIINYLSWPAFALAVLSCFSILKTKNYQVLPLFVIVEMSQIVCLGATYFARYFYLLTLVCYILIGLGIAAFLEWLKKHPFEHQRYLIPVTLLLITVFSFHSVNQSYEYHSYQHGVTAAIGQWLNAHSTPGSTVLLTHLGYTGWYADRFMIDDIGLVTPKAVEIQGRIPRSEFFRVFWPDYVVWVCGADANQLAEIVKYYDVVQEFGEGTNPCIYEIWKRKPADQFIVGYVK